MRLLVCLLLCLAATARAETLSGVVIVVIDGDTVLFKPDHYAPLSRAFLKLRLAGIDAPESGQPHGAAAARALKSLVLKRRATFDSLATDRYGRRIGWLNVAGDDASTQLVAQGHAWATGRAPAELRRLAVAARQNKLGLWSADRPVPPWDWRAGHSEP
ncbi:MAG: thermonuclease family protein [Thiobacillus sp.]